MYKYLKQECKDDRTKFFSVVPSERTGDSGQKIKHVRVHLKKRELFLLTEHWQRLPAELVESSSLEILKRHLGMVLGNSL